MTTFDELKNVSHGPYISELKPAFSLHKVITAPMIGAFGRKDIPGAHLSLGMSLLPAPFMMISEPHNHEFDQFMFFISGDPSNFTEFDAEVELTLDGTIHSITYASWVYVPKRLMHCPLNVKRVGKPIIFIDARLTEEASVGPGFQG